jgi:hypothetical protein
VSSFMCARSHTRATRGIRERLGDKTQLCMEECKVCLDENKNPTRLPCGHFVCVECWERMGGFDKTKNAYVCDDAGCTQCGTPDARAATYPQGIRLCIDCLNRGPFVQHPRCPFCRCKNS